MRRRPRIDNYARIAPHHCHVGSMSRLRRALCDGRSSAPLPPRAGCRARNSGATIWGKAGRPNSGFDSRDGGQETNGPTSHRGSRQDAEGNQAMGSGRHVRAHVVSPPSREGQIMTDIAKLLFEMRERPQDFAVGECCFKHAPSRQEFWVASGFWFYSMYEPHKIKFTFADKVRFSFAFRRYRRAQRWGERTWLRSWLCEPSAPAKIKVDVHGA